MLAAMKALVFVAALAACGGAPTEPLATLPAKPRPAPVDVEVPTATGAERWLLLEQHAQRAPTVRHVAVELGADLRTPPTTTDLGESPALALYPNDKAPHHAVAAHDGTRWVQVVDSERGGLRAVVRSLPASTPLATIELGDITPAALHLVGDALWIGARSKVGWADLAERSPKVRTLVERDQRRAKYYDLFAHSGDRLIAIDDVVRPLYADWFALDARGAPGEHLGDWILPGMVNGHYTGATLVRDGEGFALFTTSTSSSGYSGPGQGMFRLPIAGDAYVSRGDAMQPDISETDMTRRRQPSALVAGTTFTAWEGFAVSPDGEQVLIAAGERGLLVMPSKLPSGVTAATIDLGGKVRDVTVRGAELFALVSTEAGTSELVVLAPDTLEVAARHALPGELDRFVD
jgi:hypothetical protein